MQTLWLMFDDIAGKGIDMYFIVKFLWYSTLIVTPQALPIGILLSSIMTLGSLSEDYEFAAAKSAGISLPRMVRPLVLFALLATLVNFLFLNYVFPHAMLKSINLKINIRKKQPTLALVAGSFNTEIPDYHIKFDEKYGKEKNLLKNVMIYDLSERRGNTKIITAKKGKIISDEGSRYMTLVLKDGYYFEHHTKNTYEGREKMPSSNANFKEYTINIDLSSLSENDLNDLKYTKSFNMLSVQQLGDTLPVLKESYDEQIKLKAENLYLSSEAQKLHKYPDSIVSVISKLNKNIPENFTLKENENLYNLALSKAESALNTFNNYKDTLKIRRKIVNLYDVEYYNRVAFSLSCLLLFFIGAPLGSIIRKGGMGLPMILAILIYVTYFFSNTFGRKLAENSSVSAFWGSWLSVIIMLPFAFILTRRAARDKGLFNINSLFVPFINFFKGKIKKEK